MQNPMKTNFNLIIAYLFFVITILLALSMLIYGIVVRDVFLILRLYVFEAGFKGIFLGVISLIQYDWKIYLILSLSGLISAFVGILIFAKELKKHGQAI